MRAVIDEEKETSCLRLSQKDTFLNQGERQASSCIGYEANVILSYSKGLILKLREVSGCTRFAFIGRCMVPASFSASPVISDGERGCTADQRASRDVLGVALSVRHGLFRFPWISSRCPRRPQHEGSFFPLLLFNIFVLVFLVSPACPSGRLSHRVQTWPDYLNLVIKLRCILVSLLK